MMPISATTLRSSWAPLHGWRGLWMAKHCESSLDNQFPRGPSLYRMTGIFSSSQSLFICCPCSWEGMFPIALMNSIQLLFNADHLSNHALLCSNITGSYFLAKLYISCLWVLLLFFSVELVQSLHQYSCHSLSIGVTWNFADKLINPCTLISVLCKISGCGQNIDKFSARVASSPTPYEVLAPSWNFLSLVFTA